MAYVAVGTDAFSDVLGTALTAHNAKWHLPTGSATLQIGAGGNNALGSVGGRSTNYWTDAVTAAQYSKALLPAALNSKCGVAIRMASGANSYFYAQYEIADGKVYAGQTIAGVSTDWDLGFAGFILGTDEILLESDPTTSDTIYLKQIRSGGAPTLIAMYSGRNALSGGFVGVMAGGGNTIGLTNWEGGNIGVAAPDTTPPIIAITSPTAALNYATPWPTIALSGTASDDVAVTSVTWSNNRGGSGTASGTAAWIIASVTLQSGANVLTVTAHDAAGNTADDVLTVTYTPGSLVAFGSHANAPAQNGGRTTVAIPLTVAGLNPVIVAGIAINSTTATVVSAVWSKGSGTALLIAQTRQSTAYFAVWAIPAPVAGAGTLTITISANVVSQFDAAVFIGADQTTPCPIADAVTSNATANPVTVTPLSLAGNDATYGGAANTVNSDPTGVTPNQLYLDISSSVNVETGYATGNVGVTTAHSTATTNRARVSVRIQAATLPPPPVTGNPGLANGLGLGL